MNQWRTYAKMWRRWRQRMTGDTLQYRSYTKNKCNCLNECYDGCLLLTLGAHAQRGLQYLVCYSVCPSVRHVINPRRACAERVTVVVSCVCVCLSEHAILAVRAIRSITKDAIVLIYCMQYTCIIIHNILYAVYVYHYT